jgi:hypothetical protein
MYIVIPKYVYLLPLCANNILKFIVGHDIEKIELSSIVCCLLSVCL